MISLEGIALVVPSVPLARYAYVMEPRKTRTTRNGNAQLQIGVELKLNPVPRSFGVFRMFRGYMVALDFV